MQAAFGIPKATRENAGIVSRTITQIPTADVFGDAQYGFGADEEKLIIGFPIGNAQLFFKRTDAFRDYGDFDKKCKNCKPGQGVKDWSPRTLSNEQRCGYHRNPN